MKKITILLCIAALTACSGISAIGGETARTLSEGWTLRREGSKVSYKAEVPSTVAGVLADKGVIPAGALDGVAYKDIDKSIFDEPWTYSTTFKEKIVPGRRYELVFDGLNYYADIFFNGKQLASSDTTAGVFIRRAYDVTSLIKKSNKLEVRLRRAEKGDLNIGFVDWNPRPVDESMGIVRPVTLRCFGEVSIEDVFVIPTVALPALDKADLEVRVKLCNHSASAQEAAIAFDLEGTMAEVPVSLAPGETKTVSVTPEDIALLHIDNPRIWWTYDLGTPELYDLGVKVLQADKVSDERSETFGVRSIESRITPEGWRQFTLNGTDVLIKGGGWTDDIFLRDTPESMEMQVEYVKDMHLNTIRFENIWGKDDTIYDLCDRHGVLALVGWSCQWEWEDYCGLPETKGYGCINDPASEDLAVKYFRDQVVRLHNHASVIGWMTGSDRIPNPRLEKRYMEIYDVEEYRPYICSAKQLKSEYGGPSGTKMEGPYEYVGPDYWYFNKNEGGAFGFNTETGIGANIPQIESIRRMVPEADLWPCGPAWDYHCTASSSAMNSPKCLMTTAEGLYGPVASLEDFVRKAHAVDYNGTRAMFESFRVRRPVSTGIVQWMLNSAWPSFYWQLYDWYGIPTAAYYGTRKACEPIQLIFDYADRKVHAVNETAAAADLTARVRVFDAASAQLFDGIFPFSVEPGKPVPVADLSRWDGAQHFVALEILGNDGKKVADNFYALGARDNTYNWKKSNWYITPITEYSDLGFVFAGKADVASEVLIEGTDATVTLTNNSDTIAPMVILKAFNAKGELAAPAFWSDNFIPLLPRETRVVTCHGDGSIVKIEIDR